MAAYINISTSITITSAGRHPNPSSVNTQSQHRYIFKSFSLNNTLKKHNKTKSKQHYQFIHKASHAETRFAKPVASLVGFISRIIVCTKVHTLWTVLKFWDKRATTCKKIHIG